MPNENSTADEQKTRLTSVLSQKLPDTIPELQNALKQAENSCAAILKLRVAAYKTLQAKRQQFLHPKDKEYTDMDRKIILEAATSEHEADYELLKGQEKALEQRIEVIKVLLK